MFMIHYEQKFVVKACCYIPKKLGRDLTKTAQEKEQEDHSKK
jgi:hypothetical protein